MFRQGFTCPALLAPALVSPSGFRIRGCHPLWPAFPDRSPNRMVSCWWLVRVRSPLLTESRLISVPPGTEMFQFPGFAPDPMDLGQDTLAGGFPHSEISGSMLVASSPELFAGCHVFHRLWSPRHPPYALGHLTRNPKPWGESLSLRRLSFPVAGCLEKLPRPVHSTSPRPPGRLRNTAIRLEVLALLLSHCPHC
jgi:hypothetical protein